MPIDRERILLATARYREIAWKREQDELLAEGERGAYKASVRELIRAHLTPELRELLRVSEKEIHLYVSVRAVSAFLSWRGLRLIDYKPEPGEREIKGEDVALEHLASNTVSLGYLEERIERGILALLDPK